MENTKAINKSKPQFLKSINKVDKLLAAFTKEKKEGNHKQTRIEMVISQGRMY